MIVLLGMVGEAITSILHDPVPDPFVLKPGTSKNSTKPVIGSDSPFIIQREELAGEYLVI